MPHATVGQLLSLLLSRLLLLCVCVCVLYVDFWSRFLRPGANVGILAVFVADYLEAHLIWVRALALARLAWLDVY